MDVLRIENFLAHYASKYYDPVKAREYYLRTRELKDREPALSKETRERQSQANAYVTNEIKTRRTADLEKNSAVRDQLNATAQAQAEAHAVRMERIRSDTENAQKQVQEKLKAHIEKIASDLKIPENASPKLRAFLERQRATRLNNAATKAKTAVSKIRDEYRSNSTSAREEYQKLRETNTAAKRANADERRTISDTYRNDLQSERQYIKDQVR